MRAIVQRVAKASVSVGSEIVGEIDAGLCVLVGVTHTDSQEIASKMAERLAKLRVFADESGKMNSSVVDVEGELLVVSQFTLYADRRRGNRPSFGGAARREYAEPLVDEVISRLRSQNLNVASGQFGAMMQVSLVNDGPVTIALDID